MSIFTTSRYNWNLSSLSDHLQSSFRHMIIHSDSTSAIERASHIGVGPGQRVARDIFRQVSSLNTISRSANIQWVKGHSGAPGNEAADALAGMEGTKIKSSPVVSLTHLKTRIAKIYSNAKTAWSNDPGHIGRTSIGPPPPPKKSCLDRARNCLERTVAQIRCGHWRSAVYFKRIRRRTTDHCWFCNNKNRKMTRSHVLLHCPSDRLVAAR
jgi:hypothetical protein